MSWFKKISRLLKSEDDIEEQVEFTEELEQEANQLPDRNNRPKSKGKEIEARMTYQYPKGEFRFPLIPDQGNRRPRPERKQTHQEESVKPVKKEKKVIKQEVEPSLEKKPPKNSTVHHQKKPKTVEPKINRPFRPTEIPSPIYGFNRPKSTEKVEIELRGIKTVSRRMNEEISAAKEALEEKKMEISEQTGPVDEKTAIDDFNDEYMDPMREQEFEAGQNHDDIVVEKNRDEEIAAQEPEEEPKVQNPAEFNDFPILQDEKMENVPSRKEDNIGQVTEEVASEESKISGEQENQSEPVERTAPEYSGELLEENPEPGHLQEEEGEAAESPEPKKSRSHIPFNVIMLKQDRNRVRQETVKKTANEPDPKNVEPEMNAAGLDDNVDREFGYQKPALQYLTPPVKEEKNQTWLYEQSELLNQTLANFNVQAQVVNVTQGPAVTRFEVQPAPGVKVNKITNLTDDIKLSLAAKDIRMEAPIPGKHAIGIEVPNHTSRPVFISEIISSSAFRESESTLTAALGLDISGNPIVTDLKKMPHGLIAGATGSGKSVCINSILVSLLYKATPDELKLLLIDPKMVELAPYNHIPHLVSPVITDVKAATAALKWAVEEMERRYQLFAHTGVRDINRFNELAQKSGRLSDKLPYMVIVIDELADLMMMSPADVEEAICRIAQKARACGIHLIIATQRPSVDVITGLIKANVPTRVAFSVSSQVDSRTIIDISGAERLLGKGDMLFLENGSSKPVRLQGTFVSDDEIDKIVEHVRNEREPNYLFEQEELLKKAQVQEEEDELFFEACEFVVDQGGASTSALQRRFHIGYNRAARLIEMMERQGIVSESRGSRPRDVLISEGELESIQDTSPNV
ncbi:DNA translocase FtsK [Falsibacillus albus]|uniref:DNA translocase FtsK n=1 Tax=Falsibacillus albus TaxID=2478915 RepID=A0A3L7K6X8_9BACI|nr:DNA translocase FtsK [Falsibacillus albus]RLQ97901.1 DNA translocase FtsK [Falsibacillus albus]